MPKRQTAKESLFRGNQLRSAFSFIFNRRSVIVLTVLFLLVALVGARRIRNRTHQRLEEERRLLETQNLIPFEKKFYAAITSKEIELWQSYKSTRALIRFKDSYFLATDGGLVELGPTGNLLRHYTVLDGLPESDLLSLATFNSQLFIGTRAQGLLSFDGERFSGYRWTDRVSQSINALFEDDGRLLIGTMAGGLIEFDGRQFREIKAGADHKRLVGINYLSKNGARLFVGTFADGLWIEEGARWSHLTVADGLLSNRIVGVIATRENLLVACDYGLTAAPFSSLSTEPAQRSQRFRSVAILPSLSSMISYGPTILLCKDNGDSFRFQADEQLSRLRQITRVAWHRLSDLAGCHLTAIDEELWILSSEGLFHARPDASEASTQAANISFSSWGQMSDSHALTTNLISALALDSQGRLWAGSFRNGIDVLTPQGKKLAHLESEVAREVNSLAHDQVSRTVLAATSQGVLRFDASLRAVEHFSTADGLLSSSVLQVAQTNLDAPEPAGHSVIACATSKGLSIGVSGKLRGLTTVQGLPSNSLYTLLVQGRKTYVGTLGGLAIIEDGRVARVLKDTNSKLTNNWVTALCVVGSRLFFGTYGGGVFELSAAGELRAFSADTGRAVVNPNAMWSDGSRLYVGTLDGALMFDPYSQKWTRLKDELPSRTVLSVTGDEKYMYFGTTSGIARIARSYWNKSI
jgi:ligand-binding sensor domain-containing protein